MGGGTMRTIGRVVGAGAVRGSSVIPLAEKAASIRKTSSSASTSVASSGDSEKGKFIVSAEGKPDISVSRRSACEVDDWEFAEGDISQPDVPRWRMVFDPPPTREEAIEATADLRQTLQKMYFSSPDITGNCAPCALEASNSSEEFISNKAETIVCVANPMIHNNVMQAFSLLNERADVQNMVASLASDQHIWEAVKKNEKVLEFCMSNSACILPKGSAETVPVNECFGTEFATHSDFWCFMNDVKLKMCEFISKVSEIALSFMRLEPKKSSKDGNNDFVETAVRASFMLAVVVMFVVILKRVP